jgi:drug/metabolite transporter (DMT)-like permease
LRGDAINRIADIPRDAASGESIAEAAAARRDDPLTGIFLILLAVLIFSFSDASAKYLTQTLPALEIAWLRFACFVAILLPALAKAGARSLRSQRPLLQVVRGLSLVASSVLFVFAVRFLPMADATAMSFVSPLFTTALAIPFLGEKVGVRRWSAVVVGLIGVLIVVRPGTSAFHPAAIFPILSAMSWAMAMVITQKMSHADGIVTMLAYAAGVGFLVLTMALPFIWVPPTLWEIGLGIFIGVSSTAGQWLVVQAYRRASASVLAPFSYSQLLWSGMLGFAVFSTIPDRYTLLGATIIVASGIYTAHREHVVSRGR